jgi:hypothetical protein
LRPDMRVDSMIDWFLDTVLKRYARKHRVSQVADSTVSVTRSKTYDKQFCGLPQRVQAHLQKRYQNSKYMKSSSVQPISDDATTLRVMGNGGTYRVDLKYGTCTCEDFCTHRSACKHIFKVLMAENKSFSSLQDAFMSRPWLTVDKQSVDEGASQTYLNKVKEVRASVRIDCGEYRVQILIRNCIYFVLARMRVFCTRLRVPEVLCIRFVKQLAEQL